MVSVVAVVADIDRSAVVVAAADDIGVAVVDVAITHTCSHTYFMIIFCFTKIY